MKTFIKITVSLLVIVILISPQDSQGNIALGKDFPNLNFDSLAINDLYFYADIYGNDTPEAIWYTGDLAQHYLNGFGNIAHTFHSDLKSNDVDIIGFGISSDNQPNAFEFELFDSGGTKRSGAITVAEYAQGNVSNPSPTELHFSWEEMIRDVYHFKLHRNVKIVPDERVYGKFVIYENYVIENMGLHFTLLNFTEQLRMDDRARLRSFDNNAQNETLLAINDYSTSGYPIFAKVYLAKDYIQSDLINDGSYVSIKHVIIKNQVFPPQAQLEINSAVYLTSTAKNSTDAEMQVSKDAALYLEEPLAEDSWWVRSYNTDDISGIFLNGLIVAETKYGVNSDSRWVLANAFWKKDDMNSLSFATLNTGQGSSWGFSLKRNDSILWDTMASGSTNVGLVYQNILQVTQDGQVIEYQQPNPTNPLSGQWEVVFQVNNGAGFLLVDNKPVASGTNNQKQQIDISNYLGQTDNILHWNVWSDGGAYNWRLTIRKDSQIVWENQITSDNSEIGRVHHVQLIIDRNGNIFPVLDLPVDYKGRSNNSILNFNLNFNNRATSIFDHNRPDYEYGNNNGLLTIYTGDTIPNPGGVDACNIFFNCYSGHPGYDIDDIQGPTSDVSAIYPAADGEIIAADTGWENILGCHITIDHGNGWTTIYGHVYDASNGPNCSGIIQNSGPVTKYDRIGTIGCTGSGCDGSHLHFEVRHNGVVVDPSGWESTEPDPWTDAVSFPIWYNRNRSFVIVDPSIGGQLSSTDKQIIINIPAGFSNENLTFYFSSLPAADPEKNLVTSGISFSLIARDQEGSQVTTLSQNLDVVIHFPIDILDFILGKSLSLYYYDGIERKWIAVPTTVDTQALIVTAQINHLSRFALMGEQLPKVYLPIIIK